MKSLEEIQEMLVSEIHDKLDKIRITDASTTDYYNEQMGNVSFLLAGLLGRFLSKTESWSPEKWIDDSLLTKVQLLNNKLSIWGIMIWGTTEDSEQWTEPFYFEIDLLTSTPHYTILFADLKQPELSYEDFKNDRRHWDKSFYSNSEWTPSERDWNYIFNSNLQLN